MHVVCRSQKWRQLMDSLGKTSCEDYRNVSADPPDNIHLLSSCPGRFLVLHQVTIWRLHTALKMRFALSAAVQAAPECERYLSDSELCVCVGAGGFQAPTLHQLL